MLALYHTILYQPLFNSLMFLYQFLGQDMGLAIILLTIAIRLALFYPSLAQLRAQRSLQATQPKLKALQEQYKGNKEEYSKAVLQFYKENKVNPLASCLPLLIQFPILIALYQVFQAGLATDPGTNLLAAKQLENLYTPLRDFFSTTPVLGFSLGLFDVAKSHNIPLTLLATAATFWQTRMLLAKRPPKEAGAAGKDEDQMAAMNRNMAYITPLITLFFTYSLPAGIGLYWFSSTLFQVIQQYYFLRRHPINATNAP